jgi:hypothetical protein
MGSIPAGRIRKITRVFRRFAIRHHAGAVQIFEHDPEKACPALDAGCAPVFRNDPAPENMAVRQFDKRATDPY